MKRLGNAMSCKVGKKHPRRALGDAVDQPMQPGVIAAWTASCLMGLS